MKKNLNSKIIKLLITLFVAFAFLTLSDKDPAGPKLALAGTGQNIGGFAWSENIGWVSFNSMDCDIDGDGTYEGALESGGPAPTGCPTLGTALEYGVNMDENGDFSGYAWSNNIGWVAFGRIKVCSGNKAVPCSADADCSALGYGLCAYINPPALPYNGGTGKIAHYDSQTSYVNGWAYILTLGDEGWLKLRKEAADAGVAYGVSVDTGSGGEFLGWGWNGNSSETGIGWLSFNCEDTGTCATAEYHVQAPVPTQPANVTVAEYGTPDSCTTLRVTWTDSLMEDGYNVFRDETSGFVPSDLNRLPPGPSLTPYLNANVTSKIDAGLAVGNTYYYRVRAINDFGYSDSAEASGSTNPICSISAAFSGIGVCPDKINLTWSAPQASCTITDYELARCECNSMAACNNSENPDCPDTDPDLESYVLIAEGDCVNPVNASCSDDSFSEDKYTKYYRYIIRGHCQEGDIYGDWSGASDPTQPCPKKPKWIEEKVR